jgi:hypothetical protein
MESSASKKEYGELLYTYRGSFQEILFGRMKQCTGAAFTANLSDDAFYIVRW